MINQIDCWDQLVLVAAIFLAEVCQGTTGVRFPLNNLLKGPRILARSHKQNKTKQNIPSFTLLLLLLDIDRL